MKDIGEPEPTPDDYRDSTDFKRFTATVLRFIASRTTGTKYAHFARDKRRRFKNGLWLNEALECLERGGLIRSEYKGVTRFFIGGKEITPAAKFTESIVITARQIMPDLR